VQRPNNHTLKSFHSLSFPSIRHSLLHQCHTWWASGRGRRRRRLLCMRVYEIALKLM